MAKNTWQYWEAVIWLDHDDALQRVIDMGITGWISPVHDDSESEKEHRHVLWKFPHPRSYDQVMGMIRDYGCNDCINTVQYVPDERRRGRYLCHLDEDPDFKKHYDPADVICMGDVTYDVFTKDSSDEKIQDVTLIELIDRYRIVSFAQLVKYCIYVEPRFYRSVSGRCGFWSAYLKSYSMDPKSSELQYLIDEKKGKQENDS